MGSEPEHATGTGLPAWAPHSQHLQRVPALSLQSRSPKWVLSVPQVLTLLWCPPERSRELLQARLSPVHQPQRNRQDERAQPGCRRSEEAVRKRVCQTCQVRTVAAGGFSASKHPGNSSSGAKQRLPPRARSCLWLSRTPAWRSARWWPRSSPGLGWGCHRGSWLQLPPGPWAGPGACSGRAGSAHRCGGASPSPCAGRRSRSTGRCCSRCTSRWLCGRSSSSSARPKTPCLKGV